MPARGKPINLLPPTDFEMSFWGKFLKWAVTAGRYIIIVTELVVIVAFLSRFKLDQDVADLVNTLEAEKNVLEAQQSTEAEFRRVQARLASVGQMVSSQLEARNKAEMVAAKIPLEVKLLSMRLEEGGVTIVANTLSEQALGEMLGRFSRDERVKGVDMTNVEATALTGITATLTIKL